MAGITDNYEVICINDGSRDRTLDLLHEYRAQDDRIKIINLSRNFGKDAGLTAGLDFATGDAVVMLDADLQDPPELIPMFVEKWREGFDVVYGQRRTRDESWFKRSSAAAFYFILSKISGVGMPRNIGDFRLLDRQVVEALSQVRERNRFMKGL